MKILIYIIVAALGVLAGALAVHSWLAPEVAVLTGRAESLAVENKTLKDQADKLTTHARRLEQQLAEVASQTADAAAQEPPVPQALDEPAEPESEDVAEAFGPSQGNSRRGVRQRGQAEVAGTEQAASETGQPEEGRGDSESRQARFREFEQQMRDRVSTVLQDEYASAPDADTQERIQILQDYTDQMAQLREEMRNAESDEERDALRQTMRESYMGMQEVVRTQQDSMLRSLATNSGITDPGKQDAFITGLRDMQASPFFQTDRMMGGGGGRGPWRPDFHEGRGGPGPAPVAGRSGP
ncbi:MAG: hypothetical protein NTZ09_20855 [Candidatus Hydrogenedentes bacterium]|nr:hypothetical protein [Candidatus Hydrogenedentota bacterium]